MPLGLRIHKERGVLRGKVKTLARGLYTCVTSMLREAFMGRFGKGDQGPEQRIRFVRMLEEMVNTELFTEFGCGRFQDGFLHLFSQDLDVLDALLEILSFLLPDQKADAR